MIQIAGAIILAIIGLWLLQWLGVALLAAIVIGAGSGTKPEKTAPPKVKDKPIYRNEWAPDGKGGFKQVRRQYPAPIEHRYPAPDLH